MQTIIAQAVSTAAQLNRPVTVAVTDREANVLAVFKMTGAPASTQFRGGGPGPSQVPSPLTGFVSVGLDGTVVAAKLAAISKAGTASLFSTHGNAFTRLHIFLYTLILFATCLLPFVYGMSSWLYLACAVALGAGFCGYGWRLWREYSDDLARRTFRFSLIHLSGLFAALLLDHYIL